MAHSSTRIVHRPRNRPAAALSIALGLGIGQMANAQVPETGKPDSKNTIIVTGKRGDDLQLGRIVGPIVDTPQSITTISSDALAQRGISNLNDALRNVAGISLGAGETSFQGNNAVLRGFTTRNDLFLDNIRDYGYYYRDTFDDASIEVLKGPSSILFGRGSTGGVIHRVSKKPQAQTFANAEFRFGFDETRRIAGDINIANIAGENSAFRINAVYHKSAVESRDTAFSKRFAVAPKFSILLGSATELTASYLHQEERNRPDYGIPYIAGRLSNPGVPAPVSRSNYYGFTNDFLNSNVNIGSAKLHHTLNEATDINFALRYSHNTRAFRYSEAIVPASVSRTSDFSQVTVSRNLFQAASRDEFLQSQTDITTKFNVGASRHIVIAGVEFGRESTNPTYVTNFSVPSTSLLRPTGGFYDSRANSFVRLRANARSDAAAFFAIDTIEFGEKWRAVLGLRWDSFRTQYRSTGFNQSGAIIANTANDRTDRKLSYRGALIYKPVSAGSIYLAYANSFNPSGEGVESLISAGRSVAQANLNLAPETSTSVEFGAKFQMFNNRALLSASVFRTEKDNVRVPDPSTPGFNALGGRQRVDGAEIALSGEILPGLTVQTAYSFLDSQTLRSSASGPLVGEPLTIAARHMFSLSTSYAVTKKANLGFNVLATSKRLGQNTPASYLVVPGYAIFDISGEYKFTPNISGQIIVSNIGNKLYYDQLHPVHVIPGAGRTAQATIKVSF